MNKLILSISLAASALVSARSAEIAWGAYTNATEDVEFDVKKAAEENLNLRDEIISAAMTVIRQEGWTASDVADAIKSVRELYVRDNATADGRKRWNGPIVETRVDTNTMTRTTIHENGRVFVEQAKVTTPSQSVAASNARLKTTISTKGVPKALADARLRRQAEKDMGVSNVTVTVTAGK